MTIKKDSLKSNICDYILSERLKKNCYVNLLALKVAVANVFKCEEDSFQHKLNLRSKPFKYVPFCKTILLPLTKTYY